MTGGLVPCARRYLRDGDMGTPVNSYHYRHTSTAITIATPVNSYHYRHTSQQLPLSPHQSTATTIATPVNSYHYRHTSQQLPLSPSSSATLWQSLERSRRCCRRVSMMTFHLLNIEPNLGFLLNHTARPQRLSSGQLSLSVFRFDDRLLCPVQ